MKVHSDENGKIVISKSLMTLLTLIVILLTSVASIVAYSTGIGHSAEEALMKSSKVEKDFHELKPRVIENEKDIAVIQEQYRNIDKNLEEIKKMIKEDRE